MWLVIFDLEGEKRFTTGFDWKSGRNDNFAEQVWSVVAGQERRWWFPWWRYTRTRSANGPGGGWEPTNQRREYCSKCRRSKTFDPCWYGAKGRRNSTNYNNWSIVTNDVIFYFWRHLRLMTSFYHHLWRHLQPMMSYDVITHNYVHLYDPHPIFTVPLICSIFWCYFT